MTSAEKKKICLARDEESVKSHLPHCWTLLNDNSNNTYTHSLSLSLSLSNTHYRTLSNRHSLTWTHLMSLIHTHTQSHTYAHTHTLSLSLILTKILSTFSFALKALTFLDFKNRLILRNIRNYKSMKNQRSQFSAKRPSHFPNWWHAALTTTITIIVRWIGGFNTAWKINLLEILLLKTAKEKYWPTKINYSSVSGIWTTLTWFGFRFE